MDNEECSSGCESGWTLYLEQSFPSPPYPTSSPRGNKNGYFIDQMGDEDEEEDLSMVSDASSGPPHFQDELYLCHQQQPPPPPPIDAIVTTLFSNKGVKKQNTKEIRRQKRSQDLPTFLDDTASSPFYNFSNNNLTLTSNQASMEVDFSQGYSTTRFERKSTYQDHFGFYHHCPVSGSQLQQNQWFEEENGNEVKYVW